MSETIEQRVDSVISAASIGRSEFASAVGLDASKLSKSLAGKRRFSSLELARVAEVGRCSVDWLITGREPFRPVFAQRARVAGVNDEAGARIVETLVASARGLNELDRPMALPQLPHLARRSSWYTKEASDLAKLCAAAVGRPIGGLSTHDLIAAVERVFGVVVVVAALPDGIDGLAYEDDVARVIVLATTNQPLRQRFTLAHEIAHIVFGDARQGMLEERMWTAKSKDEARANSFAAAFLVPPDELSEAVRDRFSLPDEFGALVDHFNFSPDAMAWRLFNEGLISEAERIGLMGSSARTVYMALGAAERYVELVHASGEPRPAWSLVNAYLDAYRDGEITVKPIARLVGWSPDDAEKFFALEVSTGWRETQDESIEFES